MNAPILQFAPQPEDCLAPQSLTTLLDLRNSNGPKTPASAGLFAPNLVLPATAARSRDTLIEAIRIFDALDGGAALASVASMSENIHAFGIGHLIFNGLRKKTINSRIGVPEMVDQIFRADIRDPQRSPINRFRFVNLLKQCGFVAKNQNDRQLKPAGSTPCLKALAALISERTNLSFEMISSASRKQPVVEARFQIIWVMRKVCGHSLTMIGQNMGNRDHTTVLNSINKVNLLMETNVGYRHGMEKLCEKADTIGIIQNRNLLLRSFKHLH